MNPDSLFILLLFGLPLLLWAAAGGRGLVRSIATRHWQPVPSRVVKVTPTRWHTYRLPLTLARVEYQYTVAGTTYTGRDVGAGEDTTLPSLWPAPKHLAPGSAPVAYYGPRDPRRAVLRRGAGFNDWLALVAPLAGLVIVFHLLRVF